MAEAVADAADALAMIEVASDGEMVVVLESVLPLAEPARTS